MLISKNDLDTCLRTGFFLKIRSWFGQPILENAVGYVMTETSSGPDQILTATARPAHSGKKSLSYGVG